MCGGICENRFALFGDNGQENNDRRVEPFTRRQMHRMFAPFHDFPGGTTAVSSKRRGRDGARPSREITRAARSTRAIFFPRKRNQGTGLRFVAAPHGDLCRFAPRGGTIEPFRFSAFRISDWD